MPLKSIVLFACLVASVALAAFPGVGIAQAHKAHGYYPYKLVDPGTLGGPQSFLNLPAIPLTKQGALLGTADTTIPDNDYPNFNPFIVGFPDPVLAQSFEFQNGHLANLGALPGNNSSAVFEVNGSGVGAGMSETAITDPYTGWPAEHATIFKNGQVTDLGTLPGGYETQATDINDRGQVAGFGFNGTPDPFSGVGTQNRSFIWQNGVMKDIGSLGGPDTGMTTMNARGQIAGQSFTSSTVNPDTGIPTQDSYVWQNGHMVDLGTLGGTISFPNWLNDAGEVAGASTLPGDQTLHPFLWTGTRTLDLGTLGGDGGSANFLNAAGDVAGSADLSDGTHHAFLWTNGHMHDLQPINGAICSNGNGINASDAVVGNATDCHGDELAGVLWKHGVAYDLNTLIAPSSLRLLDAVYIDDKADIVGLGVLPNGDQHVFELVPNPAQPLPAQSPASTMPPSAAVAQTAASQPRGCRNLPSSLAARLCTPR